MRMRFFNWTKKQRNVSGEAQAVQSLIKLNTALSRLAESTIRQQIANTKLLASNNRHIAIGLQSLISELEFRESLTKESENPETDEHIKAMQSCAANTLEFVVLNEEFTGSIVEQLQDIIEIVLESKQ